MTASWCETHKREATWIDKDGRDCCNPELAGITMPCRVRPSRSVLQDWVMDLPLREQGTLLTVIRGCDVTPKLPLASNERLLVGWLRWAILNPADPREVGIEGAFFQCLMPNFKPSEFGHYPLHWFSHIMHALEVIAYRHPDNAVQATAYQKYANMACSLHLYPETKEEMIIRLSEDRIANSTVVS